MAPMLRPDLSVICCIYCWVFDLEMLYDEGDIKTIKWGGKYLDKTLVKDPEKIKAMSPVQQTNKLETPLLLSQVRKINITPIEHAYALADALKKLVKNLN